MCVRLAGIPWRCRTVDTQTMWRVLGIVDRMGQTLEEAVEYLRAALLSMDAEIQNLEARLLADSQELRRTVDDLDLDPDQKAKLLIVSRRIEVTAVQVARFIHHPPDADEQIDRILSH